ncbi:hypothetical protein F441_07020 [Phytophthora nicotianae CJ01A1]|uniref:Uncharacterized protein n=2 Tax=Phytophthora nicotianae TaxID=4792 RepID=W2LFD4_PHYNI|nr:hypothetical protein L915_06909 [Phytophthora nicotianae]ETL42255.1 hypothetical protein L916_06857 [Phytophthora nicotianae]ETL95429.1 hypothetical protein L917_06725 [Phytophthora nicotianae]ETP18756.1 hypothetical protein F441_07020 [Phytophthora nicotianae CJ01A1]
MKAWSDEWRCARLQLYLRDEELFQGETVNVQVNADVMPISSSSKAAFTKNTTQKTADQLLNRWREHCEGARVQVQVVEVSETDPHASSSTPSSTTLFRQETQISHVSVTQSENGSAPTVKLKAQFDLKIRHEFWAREVLLIVHIIPKSTIVGAPGDVSDGKHGSFEPRGSLGTSLLRDEWATSQLLSLTREEAQPTPVMTRRVEKHVVVTKPLQLEVETRELATRRVGILARAFNAHSTLALAVRDLHLHLDQSLRHNASGRDTTRFRVVSGDKVPFPVVLQPQERFNFLFVLEPVEITTPDEALEGPEGDDNKHANSNTQKKNKSPLTRCSTVSTLLTLSWQAAVSMDAIMENRTIVWSPPRSFFSLSSDDVQKLMTYAQAGNMKKDAKSYADFKCVRLLPDSALRATVSPLSSSLSVGNAVTVCVTVVNRSTRTDFDLTLVLPSQNEDVPDTRLDVVGFEASHRLGLIRPGISVRRSLHVAFLRSGKCQLGPLVLVDHLTRTCYISDDWEVFIKN